MEILKKTILQAVTTGLTQGNWNATTNVPNIISTTETGYTWYVSVSGSTLLGDIDEWNVGEWATKTENSWGKVINGVSGSTGKTLIIPNFSQLYYFKIGLKQDNRDIGFFDASDVSL